jgi:hypothetical protein
METGTRLGPYEIQEKLGAGGMGEVWKATDTRLGRKVAVKVLPARFASDPERLARFEQEARAAAALNHPNIAVVFDVGETDGVHYMVQELLEGHSLRHLLHEGQPLLTRALELCSQVARALASAHRAGIVHRDLKPDNVFVTRDGQAKVLDFGLAKLLDGGAAAGDLTESPTMLGSVANQVMGTAGYMAPEQVSAGAVDARSDVFAFGCLLFETVTGRRAFRGDTVVEMLNGILKEQPEALSNIDMELPLELQRVISKCLQKDPARRYQSTEDLAVDMENLSRAVADGSALPLSAQSALGLEPLAPVSTPSRWTTALVAVAAAVVALAAGYWMGSDPAAPDDAVTRFSIPLEPGQQIQDGVILSRDGRRLAYSVLDPEGLKVILRPLDSVAGAPIDGTLGAVWPFFSPDGNWLGFSVGDDLLKVPVAGGTPLQLGMATDGGLADWGADGVILFSDDGTLYTVPAAGGERTVVASPPEGIWYRRPRNVAGTTSALTELLERATNAGRVLLVDVETGDTRVLLDDGWDPRYLPSGHLVYTREDGIWAAGFDRASGAVIGDPVRVLTGVLQRFAQAQFDVSDNGTMAYVPEAARTNSEGLTWLSTDETGPASVFAEVDGNVSQPRISPDGRRIALLASEGDSGAIWIYDAIRETVALFAEEADSLAWGRDGEHLYYTPRGGAGIYRRRLALGADPELVLPSDDGVDLTDVSPDGGFLLFTRDGDVFRLELGSGAVEPVLDRPYDEWGAVLSPDGNWLAYTAERAGRDEVFVSSYPALATTEQISNGGGSNPRWSPDGGALFYTNTLGGTYSPHDVWRVPIGGGSSLDAGVATRIHTQVLDQRFDLADYDVAADGRLVAPSYQATDVAPQRIHVVLNWFTELQRMVPGVE